MLLLDEQGKVVRRSLHVTEIDGELEKTSTKEPEKTAKK
jgi:hypothetical protein